MNVLGEATILVKADGSTFQQDLSSQTSGGFSRFENDAADSGALAGQNLRTGVEDGASKLEGDLGTAGTLAGGSLRSGVQGEADKIGGDLEKAGEDGSSKLTGALSKGFGGLGSLIQNAIGIPLGDVFNKAGEQVEQAGEKVESSGTGMVNTLSNVGKYSVIAGAAIGAGVIAESIKLGMSWEQTTTQIANSAHIPITAAQQIGDAFLDTAGKSTFSAAEIASAYTPVAGLLGTVQGKALDATQAMGFMQAAMDLAEGSGQSLSTVTSGLASVIQTYGLNVKDAAATSDVLYNTSRILNLPISQVSDAVDKLKGRLGTLAPDLQDTSTLMVELGEHGIQGSRGVMIVNTAFNTLLGGSKTVDAELQALGVNLFNAQGKFVGMGSVIDQLSPKLAGLTDQQRILAEKTLFGASAGQAMNGILLSGAAGYQKAATAVAQQGTAQDAAQKSAATLHGQLELMKSTVEDLTTRLGTMLIPVLHDLLSGFDSVFTFLEAHKPILDALGITIGTVLVVAIGLWVAGLLSAGAAAIAAITPTSALGAAMTSVAIALGRAQPVTDATTASTAALGTTSATASGEVTALGTAALGTSADVERLGAGVASADVAEIGTAASGATTELEGLGGAAVTTSTDVETLGASSTTTMGAVGGLSGILGAIALPLGVAAVAAGLTTLAFGNGSAAAVTFTGNTQQLTKALSEVPANLQPNYVAAWTTQVNTAASSAGLLKAMLNLPTNGLDAVNTKVKDLSSSFDTQRTLLNQIGYGFAENAMSLKQDASAADVNISTYGKLGLALQQAKDQQFTVTANAQTLGTQFGLTAQQASVLANALGINLSKNLSTSDITKFGNAVTQAGGAVNIQLEEWTAASQRSTQAMQAMAVQSSAAAKNTQSGVLSSLEPLVNDLSTIGKTSTAGLIQQFLDGVAGTAAAGKNIHDSALNPLEQLIPQFLSTGDIASTNFVQKLVNAEGPTASAAKLIHDGAFNKLEPLITEMLQMGDMSGLNFVNKLLDHVADSGTAGTKLHDAVKNVLLPLEDELKSIGDTSGANMIQSLINKESDAASAAKLLHDSIYTPFGTLPGELGTVIENAVAGVVSGLNAGSGPAATAAGSFIAKTLAAAHSAAQTGSPSKIMIRLGQDIAAGLVVGMGNGTSAAVTAAGQMLNAVTGVGGTMRIAGSPTLAAGESGTAANGAPEPGVTIAAGAFVVNVQPGATAQAATSAVEAGFASLKSELNAGRSVLRGRLSHG